MYSIFLNLNAHIYILNVHPIYAHIKEKDELHISEGNIYRKMAKDTDKKLERAIFFYQNEISFYEKRIQER